MTKKLFMSDQNTKANCDLSAPNPVRDIAAWRYRAPAESPVGHYIDEVLQPDFFGPSASEDGMQPGDIIMCACRDGGVLLYVTEVGPGSCKVVPMALARSPS